jgi:hypothetical protein
VRRPQSDGEVTVRRRLDGDVLCVSRLDRKAADLQEDSRKDE